MQSNTAASSPPIIKWRWSGNTRTRRHRAVADRAQASRWWEPAAGAAQPRGADFFSRGLSARSTRSEKPRPFSNGSTLAVTSSTG